jgi:hypothetical protein
VLAFTAALREERCVSVKLQPAWLVSQEDRNPYNMETKRILRRFAALDLPVHSGNVVVPSGNAAKYLSDYFEPQEPDLTAPCGSAPLYDAARSGGDPFGFAGWQRLCLRFCDRESVSGAH